jgi:hypothetical protein
MATAVCSGDAVLVELASDVGEAVPARVGEADPLDDASRERWWPAGTAALTGLARR